MTDTPPRPLLWSNFRKKYYEHMEYLRKLGLYETLAIMFCPGLLSIIIQTRKDIKTAPDYIEQRVLKSHLQKMNNARAKYCMDLDDPT